MIGWIRNHPRASWTLAGLGVALAIVVLVWFQPQNLFIDTRVDEALPGAVTVPPTTTVATTPPTPETIPAAPEDAEEPTVPTTPPATTAPPATEPVVLSDTELVDVGRAGSGRAVILELPDGQRVLRLEDLDVLNGPDLVVILSPSPLVDDRDAYDDGAFVSLGDLKANQGNQNYEIPGDVNLSEFGSVAIWCRRFNYTFNAAALDLAPQT